MKNETSKTTETGNNANLLLQTVPFWKTLDSWDGERNGKQHAYIGKISRGGNNRNISLCGKYTQIGEDGKSEMFNKVIEDGGEILNKEKACKLCLRVAASRHCC